MGGLAFIVMIIIIIKDRNKPKWKKVYAYVFTNMYFVNTDNEYNEVVEIRNNIIVHFDLSVELADKCIENWKSAKWFKENIR